MDDLAIDLMEDEFGLTRSIPALVDRVNDAGGIDRLAHVRLYHRAVSPGRCVTQGRLRGEEMEVRSEDQETGHKNDRHRSQDEDLGREDPRVARRGGRRREAHPSGIQQQNSAIASGKNKRETPRMIPAQTAIVWSHVAHRIRICRPTNAGKKMMAPR
jgi:hypothetical protein